MFANGVPADQVILDNDTVLLALMNGAHGSLSFIETTGRHSLNRNGNASITTADYKFGAASGLFDGSSSLTIENPGADFEFTGPFTMETWAKLNNPGNRQFFVYSAEAYGGHNYGFGLERSPDGRPINGISFFWGYWGWYGFWLHTSYIPPANEWHHYAVTRDASQTWRIFVDGVEQPFEVWQENYSYSPGMPLYGSYSKLIGYLVDGQLDDLRVTNTKAVYTTNFTPPQTELSFGAVCYNDGYPTNDLDETGTGTCSGDGVSYIRGSSSYTGSHNGSYYMGGESTNLNADGTGYWNGVFYIQGLATTLDSNGNGTWGFDTTATPGITHLSLPGFVDSAVADETVTSENFVWTAPRWGSAQKRNMLTGAVISTLAIPNGVELVKTGDWVWALRVGSSGGYRIHRSTDAITTFNSAHFSMGYGVAASNGYLWLSHPSSPILNKVNAATGDLVTSVNLSSTISGSITSIRTGANKIALVSGGKLVFLDIDTLSVLRSVQLPSFSNFNPNETWLMSQGVDAWFLSGGGGSGKSVYRYDYKTNTGFTVNVSIDSIEGCATNSTGFWVPSTWGSTLYHITFAGVVDRTINLGQFGATSYPKTRIAVGETVWLSTYNPTLHLLSFPPLTYSGGQPTP
ncbi:LamG domain-containing protein [bacterium]|nr:LamG domain-containing protein [bacterium]